MSGTYHQPRYVGDDDDIQSIVLDCGTGTCKAGFSGDDGPRCLIPSVVGRPRHPSVMMGDAKDGFVGQDALTKRGVLKLYYPIEHGQVDSWNDMEKLWYHIFYDKLLVPPEEHPILLTETPLAAKSNREQLTQVMFENFQFPAFFLANSAVLSLYALGRTTGTVVDVGHGVTKIVPVDRGYSIRKQTAIMDVAGRDLTDYMLKALMESGQNFSTEQDVDMIRDVKEKLCFTSMDFDRAMKDSMDSTADEKNYELPDGSLLTVNSERFRCPEVMFQPAFISNEGSGIHDRIFHSIMGCDKSLWKDLFGNILLSGAGTSIPGEIPD